MPGKRWNITAPSPQRQVALSDALKIHPIVAQLLINRHVEAVADARQFLWGDLASLHDPMLLKDMDRAVARLQLARDRGEKVLIFGDYDVDGVTSSVILKGILDRLGIANVNYIPHRMTEGYGLNVAIALNAKEQGVSLLIAVDCGISAFEAIDALNAQAIDVIVLDHHETAEGRLPAAHAIVNPKRPDCSYPFKGLASVGLACKLYQATLGQLPEEFLDLAAIGTIADVAPLRGENRIFVKCGLPLISQTKNVGLQALLEMAKLKDKKFRSHYVGFILGPRLNATGRMGSARESLDLLLSKDYAQATQLARSLEEHNSLRQKTQNDIVQEALNLVEREVNFKEHKVIVLHKPGWHKGVLGIVAARLVDRYYRPAVVISSEGEVGTGSARSIDGFHIFEAFQACSDTLEHFGGHKMAAGLTIRSEKINEFRDVINQFAREALTMETLLPALTIDAEIPLASISLDLARIIDSLEPHGEGNPSAVFCTRGVKVKNVPQVMGKETLKFWVTDGRVTLPVVGFGMAKLKDFLKMGQIVDVAYSISTDDWSGDAQVVLKLKDFRESPVVAEGRLAGSTASQNIS